MQDSLASQLCCLFPKVQEVNLCLLLSYVGSGLFYVLSRQALLHTPSLDGMLLYPDLLQTLGSLASLRELRVRFEPPAPTKLPFSILSSLTKLETLTLGGINVNELDVLLPKLPPLRDPALYCLSSPAEVKGVILAFKSLQNLWIDEVSPFLPELLSLPCLPALYFVTGNGTWIRAFAQTTVMQ